MASVRDILNQMRGGAAAGQKGPGMSQEPQEVHEHVQEEQVLMERLRTAAEQRIALAKSQMEKYQQREEQLRQSLEKAEGKKLDTTGIRSELQEVRQRVGEMESELNRAYESRASLNLTGARTASQELIANNKEDTPDRSKVRDIVRSSTSNSTAPRTSVRHSH
jgi:chromosome segregation ATPase